jgi:hypothetical protein
MIHGALEVVTGGIPQDLDLNTVELFSRFFTTEELIRDFRLLELTVRELTILKATLLSELARLIAERSDLRIAVRERFLLVSEALRQPPPA